MSRALLLFAASSLAACSQPTVRLAGTVALAPGLQAPDSAPHRLVIAAFATSDLDAGVPIATASPIANLYATVVASNGSFTQPVAFEIVSFQDVTDAVVVGWWKIEDPAGEERYLAPAPHDRMTSMREVFAGRTSGSGTARHLDLTLDGTVLDPAALPPAPR